MAQGYDYTGKVDFAKGLEGVVVKETTVDHVNGEKGLLLYRGYRIEDLAEYSNFEELAYLLLVGKLPNKQELEDFKKKLVAYREIPQPVIDMLKTLPRDVTPMSALRTSISYLGCLDRKADEVTVENCTEIGVKLFSQLATSVAAAARIRKGEEPVAPNSRLNHSANLLYMITGKEPDDFSTRAIDVISILTATHEVNCGTFACMVVGSSLSDIYSAIIAGIGAYKGPLHSGAMEEAVNFFLKIGSVEKAEDYVKSALARKEKLMGFGHRVYKTYDPRARIYKKYAKEACERNGFQNLFEIVNKVEEVGIAEISSKRLYPNADFYKPVIEYALGIDLPVCSTISCVGRICGWVAHFLEYLAVNRIFRPRAAYLGPIETKYIPIEER